METIEKVWCAKHRDGWCAVKSLREFNEGVASVPTLCDYWVSFPMGLEQREPTCEACLQVLKERFRNSTPSLLDQSLGRVNYAVKTVAAAAHLLGTCDDDGVANAVLGRAQTMIERVWSVEYRNLKSKTLQANLPVAIKVFWDEVSRLLVTTEDRHCYFFQAIHGEEANPPGVEGRVQITFKANNSAQLFSLCVSGTTKLS